jgi:hypothetical protein
MSDISKCNGKSGKEECPLKETCYRFKTPASLIWQSYIQPKVMGKNCAHYWEVKE